MGVRGQSSRQGFAEFERFNLVEADRMGAIGRGGYRRIFSTQTTQMHAEAAYPLPLNTHSVWRMNVIRKG